jgi:hypothetical protein
MNPKWIAEIFKRLHVMYGDDFRDLWTTEDEDQERLFWSVALDEVEPEAIKNAFAILDTRESAPCLEDFAKLCGKEVAKTVPRETTQDVEPVTLSDAALQAVHDFAQHDRTEQQTVLRVATPNKRNAQQISIAQQNATWAYVARRKHDEGVLIQSVGVLATVDAAIARDNGRHNPFVDYKTGEIF